MAFVVLARDGLQPRPAQRINRWRTKLFYLIYVSSAVRPFTDTALTDLLAQAREKNSKLEITGMLLYKDGNFMQVLEGEETTVRQLYATILNDPRHHKLVLLDTGNLAERRFSDWSMGFRNLNDKAIQSIPGFSQFMNQSLTAAEFMANPGKYWELLMFRENMSLIECDYDGDPIFGKK